MPKQLPPWRSWHVIVRACMRAWWHWLAITRVAERCHATCTNALPASLAAAAPGKRVAASLCYVRGTTARGGGGAIARWRVPSIIGVCVEHPVPAPREPRGDMDAHAPERPSALATSQFAKRCCQSGPMVAECRRMCVLLCRGVSCAAAVEPGGVPVVCSPRVRSLTCCFVCTCTPRLSFNCAAPVGTVGCVESSFMCLRVTRAAQWPGTCWFLVSRLRRISS